MKIKTRLNNLFRGSWEDTFSGDNVTSVFYEKIYPKKGRGVDRLSVSIIADTIDEHSDIITRKCLHGTYKFSPYLLQLISKGRGKPPREISIPTVRDKIVLRLLTNFLHEHFKDQIAKDLPNTVIKKIKNSIDANNKGDLCIIKLDLSRFYDSISHQRLLRNIQRRVNYSPFLKLLTSALTNPTMEKGYTATQRKKMNKKSESVPQGLSISNILAEIYIHDFDSYIKENTNIIGFFRFVDDIIILCNESEIINTWKAIKYKENDLNIEINEDKSTPLNQAINIKDGFEFLGYFFKDERISVRKTSADRFLNTIINQITKYKRKRNSDDIDKQKFIYDINEKITGAIDGNRKYGWIFFFSEINDLDLLSKMDFAIKKNIERLNKLSLEEKLKIKTLKRAYYEVRYSPERGYIHNYNKYQTGEEKLLYLIEHHILEKNESASYTEEQINRFFLDAKTKNLLHLEQDVSNLS